MNKIGKIVGFAAIFIILLFSANNLIFRRDLMTKVHRLEYPLMLSSNIGSKNLHMLPRGTVLYFDKSYPEGFTRYKVYINVDRTPLKLEDLADPTEIDPIDAAVPSKEDLLKLLNDYPLTKGDLESILNSKRLSKDEVKEVLGNYIR